MIGLIVGCIVGPGLCLMTLAVGLVLTRNQPEVRP